MTMLLVVAAALGDDGGRYLLQKRPEGSSMAGLWEFPGGKVEAGEQPEVALARELCEELSIAIDPAQLWPISFASASIETLSGPRDLVLLLFGCRQWKGTIANLHADAIGWFTPSQMRELAMPPADYPLVQVLARGD